MLQRNKSEARCLLGLEHYIEILPLIKKKVNSNVLSLNLKLFWTKVDIKVYTCLSIFLATFNYRGRATFGPSTLNCSLTGAANA